MLVGPTASKAEIAEFSQAFDKDPGAYIAQPLVEFSSHPTYIDGNFVPRRVDLRPFALCGNTPAFCPADSLVVALEEGSYVVNSSQWWRKQGHGFSRIPTGDQLMRGMLSSGREHLLDGAIRRAIRRDLSDAPGRRTADGRAQGSFSRDGPQFLAAVAAIYPCSVARCGRQRCR